MPAETENTQTNDNTAPVNDSRSEGAAFQDASSPQEASDFNSQQRDDIKNSTSQMVENGTLPELSLDNKAENGSISGAPGRQDAGPDPNQPTELKDGMQDKGTVRRGEGPANVSERLLGDDASSKDVKALTGALREQYRDETNNKDMMMNNLKVGHELLTDKNVDQVLSKIDDPEQRQRIGDQLTKDKADGTGADSKPGEQGDGKQDGKDDKSVDSRSDSEPSSRGLKSPESKDNSDSESKNRGDQASKDASKSQESNDEQNPDSKDKPSPDSKVPAEEAKGVPPLPEQKPEQPKPEAAADDNATEATSELPEGAVDRSQFDDQLSDPKVKAAFAGRMHSEVGSQGEDAQLAFAEEVMNRAAARDQTIMQALKGSYYPTHNPGRSSNPDYHDAIDKAWKEGTDTIEGATGNASGKVGFGAGKARRNEDGELVAPNQTVSINGERFGYEQVDLNRGWMDEYEQLKKRK